MRKGQELEKIINEVEYIIKSQIATSSDNIEDLSELSMKLSNEDNYLNKFDEYDDENTSDYNFFAVCDDIQELKKNIENCYLAYKKGSKKTITLNFYILCFAFKEKQELTKYISSLKKNRKVKIKPMVFFLSRIHKTKEYTLSLVDNIANCIKNNKSDDLKSELYAVKLIDLISLYNDYGDDLFKDNVRFHLNTSKFDYVDKNIRQTLAEDPEMFWFYHNGITLLIEDDCINRNRIESITLGANKNLSIINGAQTIYTVAEYYYSLDENLETDKNIIGNIKKAVVLLRVVVNKTNDDNISKRITKNLNSQKPVEKEDIKFFDSRIQIINEEFNNDPTNTGEIIRNGDSESETAITLINFLKFFSISIMQKPGMARCNKTKLLSDDYLWNLIDISKLDPDDIEKWFNNNFRIVLDAKRKFAEIKKYESETKELSLKYSKEFILSYYYWRLRKETNEKTIRSFRKDDEKDFINGSFKIILERVKNITSEDILINESNFFKKDSNYEKFRNILDSMYQDSDSKRK